MPCTENATAIYTPCTLSVVSLQETCGLTNRVEFQIPIVQPKTSGNGASHLNPATDCNTVRCQCWTAMFHRFSIALASCSQMRSWITNLKTVNLKCSGHLSTIFNIERMKPCSNKKFWQNHGKPQEWIFWKKSFLTIDHDQHVPAWWSMLNLRTLVIGINSPGTSLLHRNFFQSEAVFWDRVFVRQHIVQAMDFRVCRTQTWIRIILTLSLA